MTTSSAAPSDFALLYHGTRRRYVESIRANGLRPPDAQNLINEIASEYGVSIDEILIGHSFLRNARIRDRLVYLTSDVGRAGRYAVRSPELAWHALEIIARAKLGCESSGEAVRSRDHWREIQLQGFGAPVVIEMRVPWSVLPTGLKDKLMPHPGHADHPGVKYVPPQVRLPSTRPEWFRRVIDVDGLTGRIID